MSGVLAALVGGRSANTLAVTANNVTRTQSGLGPSGLVTTVQAPNTAVTGGTAPYTYAWARTVGSTEFDVSNAALANPSWSGVIADGPEETATWELTVTDADTNTATVEIDVTLSWVSTS